MNWSDCEQVLRDAGRHVRSYRLAKGWTQEELAKATKVFSRTSITNIELGRQKMTILTLMTIAIALDVAPGDILRPFQDSLVDVVLPSGETVKVSQIQLSQIIEARK